jgi:hypothetical protein
MSKKSTSKGNRTKSAKTQDAFSKQFKHNPTLAGLGRPANVGRRLKFISNFRQGTGGEQANSGLLDRIAFPDYSTIGYSSRLPSKSRTALARTKADKAMFTFITRGDKDRKSVKAETSLSSQLDSLYESLNKTNKKEDRARLIHKIGKLEAQLESTELNPEKWAALQKTIEHFARRAQESFSPDFESSASSSYHK